MTPVKFTFNVSSFGSAGLPSTNFMLPQQTCSFSSMPAFGICAKYEYGLELQH
jgi:hypothetical protein